MSTLIGIVDLARHTAFTFDDWTWFRNAHFEGAMAAGNGGEWLAARPVGQVVYAFVFGVLGRHPFTVVAFVLALIVAFSIVLWLLLEEFFEPAVAVVTVVLWSMFANHSSLEFWPSCVNIVVSLLLGTAGLLVGIRVRNTPGAAISAMLVAAAILSYQAVIPVLAVAVVVLPWIHGRRIDRRLLVWSACFGGGACIWVATHVDRSQEYFPGYRNFIEVIPTLFGQGIVPRGFAASLTAFVTTVGMAIVGGLVLTDRLSRRQRRAAKAVGAGLVVIVLGMVPFATYFYAPLGGGDRVLCVSGIGGALVFAGLIVVAWRKRRVLTAIAVAALLLGASITRWNRTTLWHLAGCDAQALQAAVVALKPEPLKVIVLYPQPPTKDNIVSYYSKSNITSAMQLAYDDDSIRARFAKSAKDFAAVPPQDRIRIPDSVWCDGRAPRR